MAPRTYGSARERILDAAERLILQRGVSQISVDAVITEAGVSKGGFFHHFATKDALLVAILDRLVTRVNGWVEELAADDPEPRGAKLRAQIALAFEMERREAEAPRALLLAIVEAVHSQPDIKRRARELNAETFARDASEGISEGRAILVQFALDGLFLAEGLGTATLSASQKQALRDALLELARPQAVAAPPRRTRPTTQKGKRK